MTSVPDFFVRFPITAVSSSQLPAILDDAASAVVTILFLWGYQCPNCDVAKRAMLLHLSRLTWPDVRWLHCNVYEDPAMATFFSLHGVPVFIVFRGRKSAGRITGWPGVDSFATAIEKQLTATAANAGAPPATRRQ